MKRDKLTKIHLKNGQFFQIELIRKKKKNRVSKILVISIEMMAKMGY